MWSTFFARPWKRKWVCTTLNIAYMFAQNGRSIRIYMYICVHIYVSVIKSTVSNMYKARPLRDVIIVHERSVHIYVYIHKCSYNRTCILKMKTTCIHVFYHAFLTHFIYCKWLFYRLGNEIGSTTVLDCPSDKNVHICYVYQSQWEVYPCVCTYAYVFICRDCSKHCVYIYLQSWCVCAPWYSFMYCKRSSPYITSKILALRKVSFLFSRLHLK